MKALFLAFLVLTLTLCTGSLSLLGQETHANSAPPAKLTDAQKRAMESIKTEAEKKAGPITLRFAEVVRRIYENMLADSPDEKLAAQLGQEMKEATWELLSIKGQSIRDSVNLLSPDQKKALRAEMSKPGAPSDITELIPRLF